MRIREKRIGGQSCYEIVEEVHLSTGDECRVIASLGIDAEPENARRRRHATLLGLERSLQRLEPLRDADPGIARKCDSLNHRIERERQKIERLTEAIKQMGAAPEGRDERREGPGAGPRGGGKIKQLRMIPSGPAPGAKHRQAD